MNTHPKDLEEVGSLAVAFLAIESAAPGAEGERQGDGLGAERAPGSQELYLSCSDSESSAALDAEPVVVNSKCGLCTHTIANSAWVTHHGLRCHVSCWLKTGESPDIVTGHGKHAPGGSCGCLDGAMAERIAVATGWKSA